MCGASSASIQVTAAPAAHDALRSEAKSSIFTSVSEAGAEAGKGRRRCKNRGGKYCVNTDTPPRNPRPNLRPRSSPGAGGPPS